MKENWVIATNGHETTWNAILYAVSLAEKMNASLTLLGVVEKEDEKHPLQAMFSRAVTLFQEKGISYELQIAHGAMEEILGENDWENDFSPISSAGGWSLGSATVQYESDNEKPSESDEEDVGARSESEIIDGEFIEE
jgi:hypothetical protein